jgi:predicted enzyme related to lactoylglutathione lyase
MTHLQGKFVWFEHMSADTTAARKFYDALFGWHTEATPMGGPEPYPMIMNGTQGIGGFRTAPPGAPSLWMSYVSVRDVNVAHAAALAAGGKSLMPPTDFAPVGRGATLADPTGAVFSVWTSAQDDRADVPQTATGDWHWNELMTPDEKKALAFYEGVIGYSHDTMDMGPQGTYYLLKMGDAMRAGLMRSPMADTPPMPRQQRPRRWARS